MPSQNPARGKIVTVADMAQFLGTSSKHVRELIEAGAPLFERGNRSGGIGHLINSHDFIVWRDAWRDSQKIGRPKAPVDEFKERIQRANATKAELELEIKR